jgi:hypothetical protein
MAIGKKLLRNSSSYKGTFLKSTAVSWIKQPVRIPTPCQAHTHENGTLTLKKENGTVKAFEYQCVCGHKDSFVCE